MVSNELKVINYAREIDVVLRYNSVWLARVQMAELAGLDKAIISKYIQGIFAAKELDQNLTVRGFSSDISGILQNEKYYNLEVLSKIADRIKSDKAKRKEHIRVQQFHTWAIRLISMNSSNPSPSTRGLAIPIGGFAPLSNDKKLNDEIGNIQIDSASLAKSAYKNADEFFAVAIFLERRDRRRLITFIANLAFACELYIKSLIYSSGETPKQTHELKDLYDQLDERIKKRIVCEMNLPESEVFQVLGEISGSFDYARYSHERLALAFNDEGLKQFTLAVKNAIVFPL
ncbi:MAG: HEPN domain-containing protein [Oscillospiraceae bacterium]|nr:HEPN domain-containing protein [Oscillospiraceae bacterium]